MDKKLVSCLSFVCFFSVLLFFYTSCSTSSNSSSPLQSKLTKGFNPSGLYSIAILPIDSSSQFSNRELDGINDSLIKAFQNGTSIGLANLDSADQVRQAALTVSKMQETRKDQAIAFGKMLGVKGVLYVSLSDNVSASSTLSYTTNDSTSSEEGTFSISHGGRPTEAGFSMWLVSPQTKQVLWTSTYYKKQQVVTDNILDAASALEGGWGTQSVQSLLASGFQEAAKELEKSRK